MRPHIRSARAAVAVAGFVATALVVSACGGSSSDGSASDDGASTGTGSIAAAKAAVDKFSANPPLEVSTLPSRPDTSTYAIQVNCTIPACVPGGMKPAMDALGFKFEEATYDISKGPSAVQEAFTQAIAKKPDVIIVGLNFPAETLKEQSDAAVAQGIKLVGVGGEELPQGYDACIQCAPSARALGALAGTIALADAGAKTEIAVTVDKTVAPLLAEAEGLADEVAKNGDGSPKVQFIEQSINATPADNGAAVVSFLQRNPNVKYVIPSSPQLNPAAALKSAGLGSQVKVVGIYPFSPVEVEAVKNGEAIAYAAGEVAVLYWRAADAAARVTMDVPVDPDTPIQSMRVMNKSNADVSLLDPADYENVYKTAWQIP